MSKDNDVWMLEYAGRIPARAYYVTKEEGIKARRRMRQKGFHVQLFKVGTPEEDTNADTKPRRNNNEWLSKLTDRFRKRNRNEGR